MTGFGGKLIFSFVPSSKKANNLEFITNRRRPDFQSCVAFFGHDLATEFFPTWANM